MGEENRNKVKTGSLENEIASVVACSLRVGASSTSILRLAVPINDGKHEASGLEPSLTELFCTSTSCD